MTEAHTASNNGDNVTGDIDVGIYQQQTMLNLYNSGIPIEIIALQVDVSQGEVENIIQRAKAEEKGRRVVSKQGSDTPSIGMFYLDAVVDTASVIKDSQTRIWKALKVKPDFNFSMEETHNVLEKFARSKVNLVILHVDIVESTRLSMTLPVNSLATIVQAFVQEMSLMVRAYGGYVLKYIGDAIIAFFIANPNGGDELSLPCINAINCARSMIKVIQQGVNPILDEYDYPEISVRIGIDVGENAVIQTGYDIQTITAANSNKDNNKKEQQLIKKSRYDILSYTLNIATKMTGLVKPNGIIIGQSVYKMLDEEQKTSFEILSLSTDIWNYFGINTGSIYRLFNQLN
jgi:adenylate cyclase